MPPELSNSAFGAIFPKNDSFTYGLATLPH